MEVTNTSSPVKTTENISEAKLSEGKTSAKAQELETYFQPTDEVQISDEGYSLQAKSETKIARIPEQVDGFQADKGSGKQNDRAKMNQIAAKIMNGKPVSPSEEKILKESDPQLYARAKAKAKS